MYFKNIREFMSEVQKTYDSSKHKFSVIQLNIYYYKNNKKTRT